MTADPPGSLGYEQALQVLHSMVGREINVQIAPRDPDTVVPRSGVASLEGTLCGAVNVVSPMLREFLGETEALLFVVGDGASGFIVHPDEFERARWWTPPPHGTFVIELAGAVLFVNEAPPPAGSQASS